MVQRIRLCGCCSRGRRLERNVRDVRPWLGEGLRGTLQSTGSGAFESEQMDEVFAAGMVSREMAADEALAEAGRMRAVMNAIDKLPKREREALLLSAMEELSTAEIGAVLGRSESSVRSLLFRARGHMRERLERSDI